VLSVFGGTPFNLLGNSTPMTKLIVLVATGLEWNEGCLQAVKVEKDSTVFFEVDKLPEPVASTGILRAISFNECNQDRETQEFPFLIELVMDPIRCLS
jgi:hypothetical protein